ncbi:hypothetical protein GMRT_16340 [Giardia muris]|uniref:Uncharacterized protein n=1 Tax=Giardia muris TaxID=5742 RepID=A0A4Z1T965_GIAMU|nr:hypothetical protein GMRT_16340 [Giardia muris]|eukprot:TNJ29687.1 hypothetical protein GMRT_16340 [Giardia muris]
MQSTPPHTPHNSASLAVPSAPVGKSRQQLANTPGNGPTPTHLTPDPHNSGSTIPSIFSRNQCNATEVRTSSESIPRATTSFQFHSSAVPMYTSTINNRPIMPVPPVTIPTPSISSISASIPARRKPHSPELRILLWPDPVIKAQTTMRLFMHLRPRVLDMEAHNCVLQKTPSKLIFNTPSDLLMDRLKQHLKGHLDGIALHNRDYKPKPVVPKNKEVCGDREEKAKRENDITSQPPVSMTQNPMVFTPQPMDVSLKVPLLGQTQVQPSTLEQEERRLKDLLDTKMREQREKYERVLNSLKRRTIQAREPKITDPITAKELRQKIGLPDDLWFVEAGDRPLTYPWIKNLTIETVNARIVWPGLVTLEDQDASEIFIRRTSFNLGKFLLGRVHSAYFCGPLGYTSKELEKSMRDCGYELIEYDEESGHMIITKIPKNV